MDRLASITAFVRVAENGGFSAAARSLNVSTTTVSDQVQALENALGVRLLNRTTRRVSLTEIGREYYERCSQILQELAEADEIAGALQVTPRGRLRVYCHQGLARFIALVVTRLLERLPGSLAGFAHRRRDDRSRAGGVRPGDHAGLADRLDFDQTDIGEMAPRPVRCAGLSRNALRAAQPGRSGRSQLSALRLFDLRSRVLFHRFLPAIHWPPVCRATWSPPASSSCAQLPSPDWDCGCAPRISCLIFSPPERWCRCCPITARPEMEIVALYPHRRQLSAKVRLFLDMLVDRFAEEQRRLDPAWTR